MRASTIEPRACAWCGAEFAPKHRAQVFCCQACYKRNHRVQDRERQKVERKAAKAKATTAAWLPDVGGRLASLDEIMRATKRPRNCSPLRWRIELRRRANAEYFRVMGGVV